MKKIILFITAIALCCHFSHAQINYTKSVGKTNGYYSVSETGAAVYEIPIYTPAGTRGMQPQLSLAYSSQSGIGAAGIGWNIKGLQCIVRGAQSIHIGDTAKNIRFNSNDLFAWNGNALIPVGNNEYRTEMESFCKITSTGDPGNPQGFTIYSKDGMLTQLDARDGAYTTTDNKIFVWNVSSITDQDGNSMSYAYEPNSSTESRGNSHITKITYAGGANRIEFEYYTEQPFIGRYIHGEEIKCDKLLKRISVISNNTTIRSYLLAYDFVNQNPLLKKVTEYGKNNEELNSSNFQWNSNTATPQFYTHNEDKITLLTYDSGWRINDRNRFIADVNADGREELIGIDNSTVFVINYTPGGSLTIWNHTNVSGLGTDPELRTIADVCLVLKKVYR